MSVTASLQTVQTLFPTPLVTFQVDQAAKLNRELLREIAARQHKEAGKTRSNRLGWHSDYDLFLRKEKAQATLAHIIQDAVRQATEKVAPKTDLTKLDLACEGWINVNPPGAYNGPHDHPGSLWSGCYYVTVPDAGDGTSASGRIEFIASKGGISDQFVKAPFTAGTVSVLPNPGMLLLFPANLTHWVHPNATGKDRVTIAFNARFKPRRVTAVPPRS